MLSTLKRLGDNLQIYMIIHIYTVGVCAYMYTIHTLLLIPWSSAECEHNI